MGYNLFAELFAEYAVGLIIIAVRLYARWYSGVRNFYWDDYSFALVVVCWTMHSVFLYLMNINGSNVGYNSKTAMDIPEDMVPQIRFGSICAFIAWFAYISLVWSFKCTLLLLYHRITKGLWQHRMMLFMAAFCFCTYLTSMLLHICGCTPIPRNWQVKPWPGENCTVRPLNYIVVETINVVTDMGILAVPFPLLIAARIPRVQKVILGLLFSSGIFVMVAAILRTYYSISDISNNAVALGWASREVLVSCIVVSAPGIKPLVAHLRCFDSFRSTNHQTPHSGDIFPSQRSGNNFTAISSQKGAGTYPFELDRLKKSHRRDSRKFDTTSGDNSSVEHIMKDTSNGSGSGGTTTTATTLGNVEGGLGDFNLSPPNGDGILVTTEYTLAHEDDRSGRVSLDV